MHLRLRGAATKGHTKVVEINAAPSGCEPYVERAIRCGSGEAAKYLGELLNSDDDLATRLREGSVVAVVGRSSMAESDHSSIAVAALIRDELPHATFLTALRRGNVRGALDMGLAPGVLPGRTAIDNPSSALDDIWGYTPSRKGLDTTGMLQAAAEGKLRT